MAKQHTIQKLYCYVDETGQDTAGALFIVAIVILAGAKQEQALRLCEQIEQATGKGRRKWHRARPHQQHAYIDQILNQPFFSDALYYAVYRKTQEYQTLTIQTIARALATYTPQHPKVTILIDGLPHSHRHEVGARLRQQGVQIRKVRGVREDENDALCRLADAVCGFVRTAIEEQEPLRTLLAQSQTKGAIVEVKEV